MVPQLNTWSPAEEVVWKGLKHLALLEEVYHCGQGWGFQRFMWFSVLSFWLMFAHQEVSSQLFFSAYRSSGSRAWGNRTDKWGQLASCNSQFYSEHWTVYTTQVKRSHRSKVDIAKGRQHTSGKLHHPNWIIQSIKKGIFPLIQAIQNTVVSLLMTSGGYHLI